MVNEGGQKERYIAGVGAQIKKVASPEEHSLAENILKGVDDLYFGLRGSYAENLSEAISVLNEENRKRVSALLSGAEVLGNFLDGGIGTETYQEQETPRTRKKSGRPRKESLEKKAVSGKRNLGSSKKIHDPSTDYFTIVKEEVAKAYKKEGIKLNKTQLMNQSTRIKKDYLNKNKDVLKTLGGGRVKNGRGAKTRVIDPSALRIYITQTFSKYNLIRPLGKTGRRKVKKKQ